MGHRFSPIVFDDINFEDRAYDPWLSYGQSKTANILFAVELDARGKNNGVRAFSLHPGGIPGMGLEKHVPFADLVVAGVIDENGIPQIDPVKDIKSVPMGAATHVWCATSPQLIGMGGVFCASSDIAPLMEVEATGFSVAANSSADRNDSVARYAVDREAARRLWEVSEEILSLRFLD
jgi:hypothetical protein